MSDLGAVWLDESRCRFRVWAPLSGEVQLHILSPQEYLLPMQQKPNGYHQVTVEKLPRGARYKYRLATGKELPDPVSRYQPEGVHGPSEAVDLPDQDGVKSTATSIGHQAVQCWP